MQLTFLPLHVFVIYHDPRTAMPRQQNIALFFVIRIFKRDVLYFLKKLGENIILVCQIIIYFAFSPINRQYSDFNLPKYQNL
jgi:hypothetical protein